MKDLEIYNYTVNSDYFWKGKQYWEVYIQTLQFLLYIML